MGHVFISHATVDDEKVNRIQKMLKDAGIETWVDHIFGIEQGDRWPKEIQDAANECDAGLFVLSPASAASAYCEAEWTRILGLGKKLYIALIETVPLQDFPLRLGTIQYADLAKDHDQGLQSIIDAIQNRRDLDTSKVTTRQGRRVSGIFPHHQLDLPLIGREADLEAVNGLLKEQNRVTQILGLGGVGKTRLAAEIANTAPFADGVVWQTIAPHITLTDLTLLIRDHLRLPLTAETDAIWTELGKRQVLVVLDNAEDCAQPIAFAERVNALNISGGTRVLVTSRQQWNELRHFKKLDLLTPSLEAAVEIFKAMADKEPPAYKLDGHEEAIAKAARRHPRLIEYAIRWLDSYPPDFVMQTLNTLKGADAEAALNELVHKTVEQLKTREDGEVAIAALRRLNVCRGGFTFEAAQALIEEVHLLSLLKQWNLVRLEDGRYDIDPLVSATVGEDKAAYYTHYSYYLALAKRHDTKQDYLGLEIELANLEMAFEWAMGET